jgi:hypothetical protein
LPPPHAPWRSGGQNGTVLCICTWDRPTCLLTLRQHSSVCQIELREATNALFMDIRPPQIFNDAQPDCNCQSARFIVMCKMRNRLATYSRDGFQQRILVILKYTTLKIFDGSWWEKDVDENFELRKLKGELCHFASLTTRSMYSGDAL